MVPEKYALIEPLLVGTIDRSPSGTLTLSRWIELYVSVADRMSSIICSLFSTSPRVRKGEVIRHRALKERDAARVSDGESRVHGWRD